MIKDIALLCRSYRRFYQDRRIDSATLRDLVDTTRLCASARNAQPLRYVTISSEDACAKLFPSITWAGYLADWDGPSAGEQPAAYIAICSESAAATDIGIAAQTILLAATEKGYGGCMIGAFKRTEAAAILCEEPQMIIALGVPKEKVVIATFEGDVKYYRDADEVHYVPKKSLDQILIREL